MSAPSPEEKGKKTMQWEEIKIHEGTLRVDRSMALIMMNMQVDYGDPERGSRCVKGYPGDRYDCPIEQVVQNVVRLIPFPFGLRVSSTDMHPAHKEGTVEVAEHTEYVVHCVEKTPGAKLIPEIKVALAGVSSMPVRRGQDPAIFGNSISMSPDFPHLIRTLRAKMISRVFFCGFPFNSAVASSVKALIDQHLWKNAEIYVVLDGVKSDPSPRRDPERLREFLGWYGAKFIFADQIV